MFDCVGVRISLLPGHLDMWPTIIMVMSSPTCQAGPAVITIMRPSFSPVLTIAHLHWDWGETPDHQTRLKLINPRNNWGYSGKVNQLDRAPHILTSPGLHQADDHHQMHQPSMFSSSLTYPEHDLICFSSSFDWIIFDSQPMPGSLSASHFLTVLIVWSLW